MASASSTIPEESVPNSSPDREAGRLPLLRPWKVFLSYTSELGQYPSQGRSYVDRADYAVHTAGHMTIDMARMPATDQTPTAQCAAGVRSCDVYVALIGMRYGSPVSDRPEVSYTELEFEVASQAGLPMLVFLLDENSLDTLLPPEALVDRQNNQRQQAFRQRLQNSGRIVERFRSPDHLAYLLERSLRELETMAAQGRIRQTGPLQSASRRRNLFISYTRVDREWVDRLQRMMKPLLRATGQQIELWDDSQIEPGDAWRAAIETALAQAKVALLLVSADYLASEFVMNVEVPKLLAAAEAEGVRVLWVSLSPCLVEHTPIAEHQAVLPPDQYLVELDKPQQDRALEMITQRIMEALKDPEQQPQAPVAKQSPAKSIIRWRISCRIWREPLVDEVDLPMALIPSDASKQIGEYLLAVDPVNLRQWQKVAAMPRLELQLNTDPTEHGQPDQPVTGISREQALEFCRRLAVHTGRYYELPSEEQWEHACRAGSSTPYSWGEDWSSTLATAMANPWGLRRMHGSVWQWCRGGALRGGSWSDSVEHRQARSRATAKDPLHPSTVGLRVCCFPFGTPFFQLETSKSQWRPLITRAACAKVLHKPLNENEFIQLEKVLRRFHILGILQLRLFLSLLADRLGDGADDPKHPLALEPDQVRISSFLSSDSNEVFTLAASAWRERGWRRLAAQAKTQREVLAEVGMASGKRQRAFQQAVERAADAFPEPV